MTNDNVSGNGVSALDHLRISDLRGKSILKCCFNNKFVTQEV
jgi:hypothetical protein